MKGEHPRTQEPGSERHRLPVSSNVIKLRARFGSHNGERKAHRD